MTRHHNVLYKKFNELLFINHPELKLEPLKLTSTKEEIGDTLLKIPSSEEYKELKDIIRDMYFETYKSPYSKELRDIVFEYNTMISNIHDNEMMCNFSYREVVNILKNLSPNSYLVGGAVRDFCRNKAVKDFDFVTDTSIEHLTITFNSNGFNVKTVGEHFLVILVEKDGESYEIANFRKDKDNTGGEIGTMEEDAQRRDFTINAGYFNLNSRELEDPNGTFFTDISDMVLKFIGKADDRIKEDYARVFRFYRFISKGFIPENKSLKAVRTHFSDSLKFTAPERLMNEIERIVKIKKD